MAIPFFGESVLDPYRQSTRLCGRNRHAVWLELRGCEPEAPATRCHGPLSFLPGPTNARHFDAQPLGAMRSEK
jgi:hypothetical protein